MKLGRLIIDIHGLELSKDDIDLLKHPSIGGIILFSRNFNSVQQIKNLIDSIKMLRSPSLIIYVDQEGGRVQRFKDDMTKIPSIELLGEKYKSDPYGAINLSEDIGWLIGYELRCIGIDVNTAPVLDINYSRSNIMSGRCFSNTPKIVSALSKAFLLGAKKSGISSICKHFPGHGFARTDSHVELPNDSRDLKTIYNEDIMPYKEAINLNIEGVMTSHVLYKNVDKYPPTISSKWLQILKNDLRYKGLIYSDDLSMQALREFGDMKSNVVKSLESGCDCIFICNDREIVERIVDEVTFKTSEELNYKLVKLSKNKIIDDFNKNKKVLSTRENIKKILEKKQIEIKL